MGRAGGGTILVLFLILAALAGCTGGKASGAVSATEPSASQAVDANAAVVGSIQGLVVDDEENPIRDAAVGLLKLDAEVRTDASGSFEFTLVPVGVHDLVVASLGYETAMRAVEVKEGEVSDVKVPLTPVARTTPFPESFQHNLMHHYGNVWIDFAFWTIGQPGGCESCLWNFTTKGPPQAMLIEITGQHSLGENPQFKASEHLYFFAGDDGDPKINANYVLPARVVLKPAEIDNQTEFIVNSLCDYYWFCYEEKREVWITAFHNMALPEGYSALPK